MNQTIAQQRSRGLVPLFIVGAGVSVPYVPGMKRIYGTLRELLENERNRCSVDHRRSRLSELAVGADRLANDSMYQSRTAAARFFGVVQENERAIWDALVRKFLQGLDGYGPVWLQEPTPFHHYIASQVVERKGLNAYCVSLNYDGLCAKAIAEAARRSARLDQSKLQQRGRFYPCRVLTSPEEIEKHFSRDPSGNVDEGRWQSIIKMRGDVFSAVCVNQSCPLAGRRTPIYEIPQVHVTTTTGAAAMSQTSLLPNMTPGTQTEFSCDEALCCPECGVIRKVHLDFPGYQAKEREVSELIRLLLRYVVAAVGSIVVCGVSGKWDNELLEFLRVSLHQRGTNVYCLNHGAQPFLYEALSAPDLRSGQLVHIGGDLQELVS